MPLEEHAFELVVNILGRVVLVGNDLIQDDAPFGLDLGVGEGGFRRQLEEQAGGLPEVLLQHGGMQDDLFLGGIGIEFAAQAVQVTVDDGSALACRAAEHRVLREMRDSVWETGFVPGPAEQAQGTVAYGGPAAPDGVPESAGCSSASHYRFFEIRFRSSARKPGAFFALTLCLRM